MTEYHNVMSCNKCGSKNTVDETNAIEMGGRVEMCEADTECTVCGHVDSWAYGFFESGQEMVSNCEKYNN